MSKGFYDKVANKFGGYKTGANYTKEFNNGDPEEVFKNHLLDSSGSDKTALDVGCADGRFTLSVAPHFKNVVAIDVSEGMLASARENQRKQAVRNVVFENQDAFNTNYESSSFDVVYNRRGPSNYQESSRLLKSGGVLIIIGIGEKDAQEIKEVFGRGQGFGKWDASALKEESQDLKNAGFDISYAQDFYYVEYYASYEDLNTFLQGVPIFEDFDTEKDKELLEQYVAEHTTDKGIKFPRHRFVIVAKKR